MAKNYPTLPGKLITRIMNHQNDQIYLTRETVEMWRNKTSLEDGYILTSNRNYVIDGQSCVRLESATRRGECIYTFSDKGKVRLY